MSDIQAIVLDLDGTLLSSDKSNLLGIIGLLKGALILEFI